MINIGRSTHTPGLSDGRDVLFQKGDVIDYRTLKGETVKVTVASDLMAHDFAPYNGYECVFPDNEIRFAVRERIVGWEGKC